MMLYLLHFDPPYKHAAHYLGATTLRDLRPRLDAHRRGTGAKLTAAAIAAGCTLTLVRTWPDGDFDLERRIKRQGSLRRVCPACRAAAALNKDSQHDEN